MNSNPLTIIGLKVQDVMGVRAVEIRPDPSGIVVVGGDNGAGKTSLISSIWFALGGKPNVPEPIRIGESSAEVQLDLGDLVVTRRWRRSEDGKISSDLRVSNREGADYRSPQSVLDALITKFGFDPFEFTRLKPRDQVERLKNVLGIDTAALEARRKRAYDDRTLVNRDIASLQAQFKGQTFPADTPDEEISVLEIAHRYKAGIEHNTALENQIARKQELGRRVDDAAARVERLRAKLDSATREHELLVREWQEAPNGGDPIDVLSLQLQMQEVEEINARVRLKKAIAAARASWNEMEEKRLALTHEIEDCVQTEKDLVAQAFAKADIADGLTYDEDGLYMDGVPFGQCNTAAQVQVAVKLAIHENPRLRVFRIADGEKLTPKSLEVVAECARRHNAQIWVEQALTAEDLAGGFREVSVFIEDGVAVGQEEAR